MELKNKMKVIAPKGCAPYLTEGEEYRVFCVERLPHGTFFEIIDDLGCWLQCVLKEDCHLGHQDWIIKKETI